MRFGAMFAVGDPGRAGRLVWHADRAHLELHLTTIGDGLYGEVAQSRFASLAMAMRATFQVISAPDAAV
jgi:exopolyphosphatase/guanosine-5'-triphosphate,3'-diphosphate pyrophosphatase